MRRALAQFTCAPVPIALISLAIVTTGELAEAITDILVLLSLLTAGEKAFIAYCHGWQ